MADDLEAFLRQAARRRAAKKRPRIEILDESVTEAEIVEPEKPTRLVQPNRPSSTTENKPPSQFDTRAAELGKTVGLADDLLEARLHETFDHQLGDLGKRPSIAAAASPPASSQDAESELAKLIQILREPDSIRQAIVLREIIDRPEHRW
jgi:hypothetical protein